jgi:hypothetical protein
MLTKWEQIFSISGFHVVLRNSIKCGFLKSFNECIAQW